MASARGRGGCRVSRDAQGVTIPAPVPDLRSRVSGQSVRADRGKPGHVTGFRAEEEFGFNAEPYVRTDKFVKILGL